MRLAFLAVLIIVATLTILTEVQDMGRAHPAQPNAGYVPGAFPHHHHHHWGEMNATNPSGTGENNAVVNAPNNSTNNGATDTSADPDTRQ